MDLSILNRPLEVSESPGLETTDARLDEIATLAQEGDYVGAANAAQSVLEENVYDVRVLGFFFYGVFLEQSIVALQPIVHTLNGVLRDNWPAFGPLARKDKQAQTALRWFFNQLLKKLQHEEATKSGLWEEWLGAVTVEDVQETLEAIEEVKRSLGAALQDASGPLLDGLGKVSQWLRSFQQFVHPAEPEVEPEPEPEEEPAEPEEAASQGADVAAPPAPPQRAPAGDQSQAYAEGSYHLQMLMRKMEAFSRLIEEQKYPRAALVADDINETITNFDPKIFFPKLFSNYLFLLAMNIGDLTAFEENKASAEWQVMKEYYKVDLDGFVNL